MHTITEQLTLLALDNAQRTLNEAADLRLGYGLCCTLLLDMTLAGALRVKNNGQFQPQAKAALPNGYLQDAFSALPSHTAISHEDALKALYAILPRLKEQVFSALVQQGCVTESTSTLKWSFALRSYILAEAHAGLRSRLLNDISTNRIGLYDSWVLQLADTCGLLWAETKEEKQPLREALERVRQAGQAAVQLHRLTRHLAEELPEAIARSHKLPKMGKKSRYPCTWEWRGFWEDTGASIIQASEHYAPLLEQMSYAESLDRYIIVEGVAENIKCRKSALEVKTPVDTQDAHTAFRPKQIYELPLSPRRFSAVFPDVPPPAKALKNAQDICGYLQQNGRNATVAEVRKKRFQVKLQSCVKVEFCTLQLGERSYLSACVEGPDYAITQAHAHNFRSEGVMEMGYVEFLKHCQMENVL